MGPPSLRSRRLRADYHDMRAIIEFFWSNGVGQNLTASALCFTVGYGWARARLLPHIAAHHEETRRHLEAVVVRELASRHDCADS